MLIEREVNGFDVVECFLQSAAYNLAPSFGLHIDEVKSVLPRWKRRINAMIRQCEIAVLNFRAAPTNSWYRWGHAIENWVADFDQAICVRTWIFGDESDALRLGRYFLFDTIKPMLLGLAQALAAEPAFYKHVLFPPYELTPEQYLRTIGTETAGEFLRWQQHEPMPSRGKEMMGQCVDALLEDDSLHRYCNYDCYLTKQLDQWWRMIVGSYQIDLNREHGREVVLWEFACPEGELYKLCEEFARFVGESTKQCYVAKVRGYQF